MKEKKLFLQVENELPAHPGEYITNHGTLYFDGESFYVKGHIKPIKITVDWYMLPVKSTFKNTANLS